MIWTWTTADLLVLGSILFGVMYLISLLDPECESPMVVSICGGFLFGIAVIALLIIWRFMWYVTVAVVVSLVLTICVGGPIAFVLFCWQMLTGSRRP